MKTIKLFSILVFSCCLSNVFAQAITCQASFTSSFGPAEGTGINIEFTSSSTGTDSILAYEWNFGDTNSVGSNPNTSDLRNPSHLYQAGSYVVCLSIRTDGQCSSSVCDTIFIPVVDPGPCYGLSAIWTDTAGASGAVHFAGTPDNRNAATYSWNFGDGSAGSGLNITHNYTSPGTYDVCLIATIPGGNCADTSCAQVVISNPCSGITPPTWTYVATGGSVAFNVTGQGILSADYTWLFGDGTTGTGSNPSHTYAQSGTYTVCLVTNYPGAVCSDTTCKEISVTLGSCNAAFTYQISQAGSLIVVFTYNATATDSIVSHTWSFGDGHTSNDKNVTHTYSSAGTYVACLSITTLDGCQSEKCDTIQLADPCSGIIDAWTYTLPDTAGGAVQFAVLGPVHQDEDYNWTFGDGSSGTGGSASHIYAQPGSYNVCLVVSIPGTVCRDTNCNTVIIPQRTSCNANFSFEISPPGSLTVIFTNTSTSGDSIVSYVWSFGDGVSLLGENAHHTYSHSGTYTVCLSIRTENGCESTKCDTVRLTVTNPCSSLNGSWTYTESGNVAGTFEFHGSIAAVPENYAWTFGDGSTGSGIEVSHTYRSSGDYVVCLITSIPGTTCADTVCKEVYVTLATCHANFTYIGEANARLSFAFTSTSTSSDSIVSYDWTFGDGTSSALKNPAHTYAQDGNYIVCLYIRTLDGCTSSKCDTLGAAGISPCHGLSASWTYTLAGAGSGSVEFHGPAGLGLAQYVWHFGDGSTATGLNVSHTYTRSGTYNVCLIASIPGTICADTSCQSITISIAECHAGFSYTLAAGGLTVSFTNESTSSDSIIAYEWSFGDGSVSHDKNISHTYAHGGVYRVCLSIGTADGCQSTTCDSIVLPSIHPCNFNVTWNYAESLTGAVVFTASAANVTLTYKWIFGDGTTGTGSPESHTYSHSGTYDVCLVAGIPGGTCSDTICRLITVTEGNTGCHAAFRYELLNVAQAVQFINASTSADSIIGYYWSFGDGSTSALRSPDHVFPHAGTYITCLSIKTIDGCVSEVCDSVFVDANTNDCHASFDWSVTAIGNAGISVSFTNTSTGAYTSSDWSFGDGSSSAEQNPMHTYTSARQYVIVCLTIKNASGSCYSSVCDTVIITGNTDCINDSLISPTHICPDDYFPVCGCNGVTYANSCVAEYYFGVTSWALGACPLHVVHDKFGPDYNDNGAAAPADAGQATGITGQSETEQFAMNIYPNPAGDKTTIAYSLDKPASVNIEIMDMVGHVVANVFNGKQEAGAQTVSWNTASASNGIYLVRISADGKFYVRRLSVIH